MRATTSKSDPSGPRQRAAIVGAIRAGRLTPKAAAAELGVSVGLVGGWMRAEQFERRRGARERFAEVALVPERAPIRATSFSVSLRGGRRLRVASGFDAAELSRLVRTLESC